MEKRTLDKRFRTARRCHPFRNMFEKPEPFDRLGLDQVLIPDQLPERPACEDGPTNASADSAAAPRGSGRPSIRAVGDSSDG